ncbi:MAG: TRAP transporter small permease subunit [Dehalococcoidia bacterium]|nr:TRAP transporter small permease subunit [Dehalococcoidia bacterium]
MRKALKLLDAVTDWVGEKLKFVVLFLILVVCSEVMMRYVFNSPTSQLPVIQTWTGTAFYALAFGYVHMKKGHVRVDVLYARLSERGKAIMDTVLWFVFFLPSIGLLTLASYNWAVYSWKSNEMSMMTYWYPPMAPVRTVLFIGLVLFLLQGVAALIRDVYFAVRSKPYD